MSRPFPVLYITLLALAAVAGAFALVEPLPDWDLLEPIPRGRGPVVTIKAPPTAALSQSDKIRTRRTSNGR